MTKDSELALFCSQKGTWIVSDPRRVHVHTCKSFVVFLIPIPYFFKDSSKFVENIENRLLHPAHFLYGPSANGK